MSLEMYSPDNILHQDFIKEIMKDDSVQDFLGNIDSQTYLKDSFLLKNKTDYVGFSDPGFLWGGTKLHPHKDKSARDGGFCMLRKK